VGNTQVIMGMDDQEVGSEWDVRLIN